MRPYYWLITGLQLQILFFFKQLVSHCLATSVSFLSSCINSLSFSWTIRLLAVPSDRLILRQSRERVGQQQRWVAGLLQQNAPQTQTAPRQPGLHPHIQRLRPGHRPRYASNPNRQPAWSEVTPTGENQRQGRGPRPLLPQRGCTGCGHLLHPGLAVPGWSAQTAAALRAGYSLRGQVSAVRFREY